MASRGRNCVFRSCSSCCQKGLQHRLVLQVMLESQVSLCLNQKTNLPFSAHQHQEKCANNVDLLVYRLLSFKVPHLVIVGGLRAPRVCQYVLQDIHTDFGLSCRNGVGSVAQLPQCILDVRREAGLVGA